MVLSKLMHPTFSLYSAEPIMGTFLQTTLFCGGYLIKGLPGMRINLTLYIHSPRPRNFRLNRIKLFIGRRLAYGKRGAFVVGPFRIGAFEHIFHRIFPKNLDFSPHKAKAVFCFIVRW